MPLVGAAVKASFVISTLEGVDISLCLCYLMLTVYFTSITAFHRFCSWDDLYLHGHRADIQLVQGFSKQAKKGVIATAKEPLE